MSTPGDGARLTSFGQSHPKLLPQPALLLLGNDLQHSANPVRRYGAKVRANEGKKAARLVNHVSHGGVLLLGHPLLCLHSSLILGVLPFLCKHLVVVRMVAILHLSDGPVHAQRSALAGKIGPWVTHKWFGDRLKYRRSGDGSVQPSSGPARHVAQKTLATCESGKEERVANARKRRL